MKTADPFPTRRTFLEAGMGAACAAGASPRPRRPRAPFRVLYSNDTTNLLTCVSPFHKKGEDFRPEMLEAAIDEAAGVDVHMLQPGLGWIPWWKSSVYPGDGHYRAFVKQTGLDPGPWGRYIMSGGDVVKAFLDHCRKRRLTAFISLRLNDGHHVGNMNAGDRRAASVSRFYREHPEWRIGPDPKDWNQAVMNWAVPEVRDHKFAFIREICLNYEIAGFELDFMRHSSFFRLEETTSAQRAAIMTGFVARVRRVLDETSNGRRRWLCVRVPCRLAAYDRLGIDLRAMVAAGLDMVNLSVHYCTQHQTDLAVIRRLVPEAAVYLEMTHCTYRGAGIPGWGDSFPFLRTTDHQFYTGAHLAYERGADGVSLFNFVYFREHGTPGRGPFHEPPFHVLKRLGDRAWLARQPQWYVLAKVDNVPPLADRPLPRRMAPGQTRTFVMDLAPLRDVRHAVFRLRTVEPTNSGDRWKARLNGEDLRPAAYIAKPLDHPYDAGLGSPGQYACFECPPQAAWPGTNEITVSLGGGGVLTIDYMDLILAGHCGR